MREICSGTIAALPTESSMTQRDDDGRRRAVEFARRSRARLPNGGDSTALIRESREREDRECAQPLEQSRVGTSVAAVAGMTGAAEVLRQRVDGEALRAELERLYPEPTDRWLPKPPDYPDTTDRRAVTAFIRKRILKRRVNNFCALCGTLCVVRPAAQVAADIAVLRDIVDYVLSEDPHASVYIRRGSGHEFMMDVECDDPTLVENIVGRRECPGGIRFAARARDRSQR